MESATGYPDELSHIVAGLALGRAIGAEAVKRGKTDGFDAKWTGSVPTAAGSWTGTNPILPLAGTWKTWLIASGDALRPAAPASPRLGPEKLGTRRAQGCAAVACDDEPRLVLGMGRRRLARLVSLERADEPQGSGIRAVRQASRSSASVRLGEFAVHDAVVACWDAKYAYWAMRPFQVDPEPSRSFRLPITRAIRRPMPASRLRPDTRSPACSRVTQRLCARSPKQAGDARIWAGIHFRSDVEAGRAIGDAVAKQAAVLASDVPMR